MARAFYPRDLDLLGYYPLVPDRDVEVDTPSYSVYKVTAQAGIQKVRSTFVYVKSACRTGDLEEVAAFARTRTNSYLVYSRGREGS